MSVARKWQYDMLLLGHGQTKINKYIFFPNAWLDLWGFMLENIEKGQSMYVITELKLKLSQ